MLLFVSPPRNSTAVETKVVMPTASEEERLQKATRELHLLFGLPIPETLEDKQLSPKVQWNHYLKSSKRKQVSWKDSKQTATPPQKATENNHTVNGLEEEELPPLKIPYNLPPPPETWPQRPHFIRVTPGSGTQIVDIRCPDHCRPLNEDPFWQEHCGVPINTGNEAPGQTIVVDFISQHFVGSVLFRMQGVKPCQKQESAPISYFDQKQRTFQAVVRGRFRSELPLTKCVSGQFFRRPAGTLPPHWMICAIEAVVNGLQPNNELHVEGPTPRLLSPLVTNAQTIQVNAPKSYPTNTNLQNTHGDEGLIFHEGQFFYDSSYDSVNACFVSNSIEEMEQEWQEPHATHHRSLIQQIDADHAAHAPSILNDHKKNQHFRKSFLNQYWARQDHHHRNNNNKDDDDDEPVYHFRTDQEYSFEFYEHMIDFEHSQLALDLKLPLLHHIPIAPCTDGQPIHLMSAVRTGPDALEYLWNFEIWHESLYELALRGTPDGSPQET
jgi:Protein of unknown function (DUF1769)